jgi:hypothetical protein
MKSNISKSNIRVWKRPGYREKMSEIHKKNWKEKGPAHRYQLRGKEHPQWKGENITYRTLHLWLIRNFGKANTCENIECQHRSKYYLYALVKGSKYERKRENFKMLCMSCHVKYDMTDSWKGKLLLNLKKKCQ